MLNLSTVPASVLSGELPSIVRFASDREKADAMERTFSDFFEGKGAEPNEKEACNFSTYEEQAEPQMSFNDGNAARLHQINEKKPKLENEPKPVFAGKTDAGQHDIRATNGEVEAVLYAAKKPLPKRQELPQYALKGRATVDRTENQGQNQLNQEGLAAAQADHGKQQSVDIFSQNRQHYGGPEPTDISNIKAETVPLGGMSDVSKAIENARLGGESVDDVTFLSGASQNSKHAPANTQSVAFSTAESLAKESTSSSTLMPDFLRPQPAQERSRGAERPNGKPVETTIHAQEVRAHTGSLNTSNATLPMVAPTMPSQPSSGWGSLMTLPEESMETSVFEGVVSTRQFPQDQLHSTRKPDQNSALNGEKVLLVVREALDVMAANKKREIELQLHPKELGRLRFVIGPADGQLMVQVFAERPETLDSMRKHVEILSREFLAEGFEAANFSFDHSFADNKARSEPAYEQNFPSGSDGEVSEVARYEWENPDARLDIRI